MNMVLAVTALLKDMFFASYLGTTAKADALLLAFFIPDTAGNNLLAAAIGTASVPVFASLYVAGEAGRFKKLLKNLATGLFVLSTVLILLFYLFRSNILGTLATGFDTNTILLSQNLLVILLPMMAIFPFITIGAAVLNVHNRFSVPAAYPVIFNAFLLFAVLFAYTRSIPQDSGVYALAYSMVAASVCAFAFIWLNVYRIKQFGIPDKLENNSTKPVLHEKTMEMKAIVRNFLPYLLILFIAQSVLFFERYLASLLGEGSVAGLNYAYRLAQFPIWVFGGAIGMAILPAMSKSHGFGYKAEFESMFIKAFKWILIVSVPVSILLYGLREPIIAVLLQRGAFDAQSLEITAEILKGYALAVAAQSIAFISLRVFLASGKMIVPLAAISISSFINIAVDLLLTKRYGLSILGYGAALGAFVNIAINLTGLKYKLGFGLKPILHKALKILSASLPMIPIIIVANKLRHFFTVGNGFLGQVSFVFIVATACSAIYLLSLVCCKEIEGII